MATLPAEVSGASLPVEAGGVPLGRTGILRGEFVSGLGALPAVRQVGLLVGIAASIALGVALVLWLQTPDYRPITGGSDTYDNQAVTELLEQNSIQFRIDSRSGMVLVDAGRFDEARIALAQADLLGSAAAQGGALTEPPPFGSSQQAENNRFLRALEAELSRSIGTVQSIKHARVHIAMPRGTAFVRDQREPSASVAVELQHGRDLERDQVRAIMNLVARAVPELKPENVSVVDQQGRLLSGQEDDALAEETDRQYQFKRKQEDDIARKVQDILLPTVGEGRFRVQVSADVDFTWQEETAEQFNPDTPAIRSEQSVDEQRTAGVAESGIPGALSNTPPAVAATPETVAAGEANQVPPEGAAAAATTPAATAGNSRRESTRNYELDRKYSHIRHQLGQVRRLTVSVLVDDVPAVAPAQGETPAKTTFGAISCGASSLVVPLSTATVGRWPG